MKGRSSRLRVNYRTTSQIKSFDEKVLPVDTLDEDDEEGRAVVSLMSGREPEIRRFDTVAKERAGLEQLIGELIASGIEARHIACFGRTESYLSKVVYPVLEKVGIEWWDLAASSALHDEYLIVGTMHRAKGLEFQVIIVVGCAEGLIPLKYALDMASDESEYQELLKREAHLLYVACSCARDCLILMSGGGLSRFLEKNI